MDERLLSGTEEIEEIHESAPPPDRKEAIGDRIKTSLKNLLQRCEVGGAEKILHSIQEIDVSGNESVEELCQLTSKTVRCIPKPDREILFKNGLSETLVDIIKELYPEFLFPPVHDIGIVIIYAVSKSMIQFFLEPKTGKEDSRTSMNISSEIERRTPEIMGRCASWWATFAFFLCLCSLKFSKPLLEPQGPNSLWLAIVGMFSFTVFVSASSVMLVVGAQFTRMQITIMLSAFLAMLLV